LIVFQVLNKPVYLPTLLQSAPVAELVDALDSKSCSFGSAGSIPARGTKKQSEKQRESDVVYSAFFLHSVSPVKYDRKSLLLI